MRSLTELLRLIILFSALAFAFPAIASAPLSIGTDGDGIGDSEDRSDARDSLICYKCAISIDALTLSSSGLGGFANEN
tara:strand:- start:1221 stop:1454 length:234 start_codon:yes stop_codon:yes gene_type:complete